MAFWEQYPDYAMRTNDQGERDTKAWVSGPSPLAMGLLTGGLGILAAPDNFSGWVSEGDEGFDPGNIARGGLLGLEAFSRGHQNLQDQRKDYYTHRSALMDQVIQNQRAKRQGEEYLRVKNERESMISGLPEMLKQLEKTKIPGIKNRIPVLRAQANAGDIKGAYQAVTNLNSQLAKVTTLKPEIVTLGDGTSVIVQKDTDGNIVYKGQAASTKTGFGSSGSLRGKAIGLIYDAHKEGKMNDPMVQLAYEELLKPRYVKELQADGQYIQIERPGYVPPLIEKWMTQVRGGAPPSLQSGSYTVKSGDTLGEIAKQLGVTQEKLMELNNIPDKNKITVGDVLKYSTPSAASTLPKSEGIVTGQREYSKDTKDSFNFANRMQSSMAKMDEMYAEDGYRPTRKVIEFLSLGFPGPDDWGLKAQREAFLQRMDYKDRIFAGNAEDWIRAKLRRESGAAIAAHEVSGEISTYFYQPMLGAPMVGADKVREDFRRRRIEALKGQIIGSGGLWKDALKGLGPGGEVPRTLKSFRDDNPFEAKYSSKSDVRSRVRKILKP